MSTENVVYYLTSAAMAYKNGLRLCTLADIKCALTEMERLADNIELDINDNAGVPYV